MPSQKETFISGKLTRILNLIARGVNTIVGKIQHPMHKRSKVENGFLMKTV